MATIRLKCPHCGTEIDAPAAVGVEKKNAVCPKCNQSSQLGDYLPKLSLKVDDKNYQLHLGKQTVGRKCDAGKADIQIPDETRYMSKTHAEMELKVSAMGIDVLYEEHAMNPTLLQGIELVENDIVYLSVNDCLQLGDVRMYLAPEFGE